MSNYCNFDTAIRQMSQKPHNEKKFRPETVQEMMWQSLYHIKWYFAKTDLNTDRGKSENKKSIIRYAKCYTQEKEKQYQTSFKVNFEGQPYEGYATNLLPAALFVLI